MANRSWKNGSKTDFIFLGFKITVDGNFSHTIKRCLLLGGKAMTNLDSMLKTRDITLLTKICLVKAMIFLVVLYRWMWEMDPKEGWTLKNWCFQIVVLEKTPESPLGSKEIQPVHPKGNWLLNIHWKDWCWSWSSNPLDTWCEELVHWRNPNAGKD